MGANAVVFRVLNALVLHPLHVPYSDNLFIRRGFEGLSANVQAVRSRDEIPFEIA
jgi:hypothetical protein